MRSMAWRNSSMFQMWLSMANACSARTSGLQFSLWEADGYFTRPKPCLPPRSCRPSMISTFHLFEARNTNHRVLRDNCCQLLHGPASRRGRLHRQDHVASICRRIPNPDLSSRWWVESHLAQHRAGLANDPRPIIQVFVPIRRRPDDCISRARAQSAHDHVVNGGRVLEYNKVSMVLRKLKS